MAAPKPAFIVATTAAAALLLLLPAAVLGQSDFDYSQQPIPIPFELGDSYPDRPETDVCRPIFDYILRDSSRFTNELVFNTNPSVTFATTDSRRMTSRMQTRLDRLREIYDGEFTVLKAWTEFPDSEVVDSLSLHYEGRTIRVEVEDQSRVSDFLTNAVQAAFDWVSYHNNDYVRLSVIPDNCENNVDMVFILDQSGSVGPYNHDLAILFILNVIQYFSISHDTTRVGFVAFSRYSHIEFDLDDYTTAESLVNRINSIYYRGGSTATALALNDTAYLLNPDNNRGARPNSEGVPKVAILVTDGKSNRYPLTYAVPHLQGLGVQVYALGIANPDVEELQFIASDPDSEHVFLLNSYNDAAGFVDFLSIQTCDTPAIVDPGDNTTTEVPEDGIRYFQVECDSFSNTVLVELFDNSGTSFLYCSAVEQNPGPLTSNTIVNDTVGITRRTCVVSLADTNSNVVYIGVQGVDDMNQFTVVVWDMLFTPAEEEIVVLEGETGIVYDVTQNFNEGANGITFQYFITEGNTDDVFGVNGNGRVSVIPAMGLDIDDSSFYSLSIVAANVEDSCKRSRFRLNVRVGRNEIIFSDLVPVSVLETASIGDEVTSIAATGGAGQIEYSILNSVPFSIGTTTGTVVVDGMLDFEDEMQYSITVEAESVGTIVSGSTTQIVNVVDVNEQPEWETQCTRGGLCTANILENQAAQAIGDQLSVTDPDLPSVPNGMITFTITPITARDLFTVDNSGVVGTRGTLDREDRDLHSFTVTAADGGTPLLSVTTTFRVMVLDENDEPPVFVQGPEQISIAENEPNRVIAQYITTDDDTAPNAQITFSLSPTGLPFELDSANGALSIAQNIDYENPNTRIFMVTITANNPPLSASVDTRIDITDVNDNAPVFGADSYSFTVAEHSDVGTEFATVAATDADSGLNGEIRFSITGGNSQGFFSIDSTSGSISVAADIDRELVGSVDLRVRARDRGSPRLFNTVPVTVTISDINDNPPVFNPDSYGVSLREDRAVDSTAFTVFATDADQPETDNSRIVYTISGGNEGSAFRIDSNGSVIVNNALNHEAIPSYTLTIRADDQGSPQLFDTATAMVAIINVNEAPPTLSGDQTIDLPESTPTGVTVASFSASDADFTPVSITIISGNEEGRFSINNGGNITIVIPLDFETTQNYVITIEASDGEQTDMATLTVNVLDDNEFAPQFSGLNEFTFDEEMPMGSPVGTVIAADADGSSPNNAITFSFFTQTNLQDYFTLDPTTGAIVTAVVLDREMLTDIFLVPSSSLMVQILAQDGGSPSLQTSRGYTFILRDINDNAPEFDDTHYTGSIIENQPSQTVLTFSAVDIDLGSNADISFSFSVEPPEGAPLFQITDERIGVIATTGGLDCEAATHYNFMITATDMGSPNRLSSTATATLALRDQNDNSPVFQEAPYEKIVSEIAPINSVVGQVIANDADKGSNGEVVYEILGQDDLEEESETTDFGVPFFEIDANTGEIRHLTPFDFETFPTVTITVRANDRGTPRRMATNQVVFTVENVDEAAPRFGSSCSDVTLSENTPAGSEIVNCMAIDLDNTTSPDDTEWITYTIDPESDTFEIGRHTGIITNTVDLDFETNNFFMLVIRATDGSGRFRTDRVTIEVEDENDNAPQFQTQSLSFAMTTDEIESNTQTIATARATDGDSGTNREIYYSIDDNGIERMSPVETRITITARDGGATPLSSTVTLTVRFDEECLLQRYTIDRNSGRVTAIVLCSVEIVPENTEMVVGENHVAYCHIVRNSPARYQWILNGSAIDLTTTLSDQQQRATLVVTSVGFQDAGAYACKVTTDAGSLQTSTYTVNILVLPFITVPPQAAAVEESGSVEFTCFAVGTPTPSIRWEFQGSTVGTGNTLTIEKSNQSSQGSYSCVAVSAAGSASQDARLVVFVTDDVAVIVINNVDQTSPDGTCHYLDPETIEELLSVSGVSTMVTDIAAENLCEINNCSPNPCGNRGTCELDETVEGGYVCTCADGYTGVNCMEDVDECLEGPCGPSGQCRNVPGLFECTCTNSTGNRCQYPTLCSEPDKCADEELCLETLLAPSGFVCVESSEGDTLTVEGVEINIGFLDDLLVNFREALLQQQQAATSRRKRASNVTREMFANNFCSPRFIRLEAGGARFGLFWDCPEGENSPPVSVQPLLCEALVQSGLVKTCRATNTSVFTRPTPPPSLPKISVTIELIQVDGSGKPLSIGETLNNLQKVTEEITKSDLFSGADLEGVSSVNPIECSQGCVNGECTDRDQCSCDDGWTGASCNEQATGQLDKQESGGSSTALIVGVVVGVVVAIIIILIVVMIVVVVIVKKTRESRRSDLKRKYAQELEEIGPASSSPELPHKTSSTDGGLSTAGGAGGGGGYSMSTEKLVDQDNDYDQLPALSAAKTSNDNDYDQLPAMVFKNGGSRN